MERHILFFIIIILLHVKNGDSCACVPEDQKLAFGQISLADPYCREKYAKVLGQKPIATEDEYESVYGQYGVSDFTIDQECTKTVKGDAFALGWYCGEYCSNLCIGSNKVTCEYLKTNDVCQKHLHCVCREGDKIKCAEQIMPDAVNRLYNATCLNCYFLKMGDKNRVCLDQWSQVTELAQECKLSRYGIRRETTTTVSSSSGEDSIDFIKYEKTTD